MGFILDKFELYLQSTPAIALLIAFAAGIFTSFTPCIYPLIPITVGVIGAKSNKNKLRGFYLSLIYVLGMAVVYAILGAVAALTGSFFGQISTNKWTYFIVGNMFLFFGLSMLDLFSMEFSFLQKINTAPGKSTGTISVFLLGGVSGLIAGPCTTPVLGTLLAYVASRQNTALGILMLFVFAFGMGTLLILVGTFTGLMSAIPRSGQWMMRIKKAFGVLMIFLGEYFFIKTGQLMF